MDYGEVLSRAWRIIWKYKILWIFGILAGFTSSGTNGSSSSSSGLRNYNFGGNAGSQFDRLLNGIGQFINNIPWWVWGLLGLFAVILFLVAIVLNTVGRIALIKGASQGDMGVERLTFGGLFSASLPYFWRVFLLNLLVGLAWIVAFIILAIPLIIFTAITLGLGLICLICVAVPLGWFVQLVVEQAIIAMVTEDLGIFPGLERAWQVVTRNLGHMIVMALVLFLGTAIVSFLIGLPALAAFTPLILAAIAQAQQRATTGALLVSAVLFLIYLPILLVLVGILRAYISTAWTLTFRRLTGRMPGGLATAGAPYTPAPYTPPAEPPYRPSGFTPAEPPASEPTVIAPEPPPAEQQDEPPAEPPVI